MVRFEWPKYITTINQILRHLVVKSDLSQPTKKLKNNLREYVTTSWTPVNSLRLRLSTHRRSISWSGQEVSESKGWFDRIRTRVSSYYTGPLVPVCTFVEICKDERNSNDDRVITFVQCTDLSRSVTPSWRRNVPFPPL